MRKILSFLAMGLAMAGNGQNCKDIWEQEAGAAARRISAERATRRNMAANTYDVLYHRCNWEIDPAVNYIKGRVMTYFKPSVALDSLQFDLNSALTVDSVKYAGANISFLHENNILSLYFPAILISNLTDSVEVFYQGAPPNSGFGSFIQDSHAGSPIIWTLSEPYGAMDWWPCKQDLADKIDSLDILVRVPQGNRVASNGKLIGVTAAGGQNLYHWKTRYPTAVYLVAIAVTNYSAFSNFVQLQSTNLEVLNYVFPEDSAALRGQSESIAEIIHLYDSLTIEYPFAAEKYGHAQFGWGGGMEHQTMSFMTHLGYSLMAHECAHQWFGDHVTCGSWEDIWLNEGFATYFEGLTVQRYKPNDWRSWKQGKINSIISQPDGSVLCTDTTTVNRIFDGRLTYNKGAYLLHMLRWRLGDAAFFGGIRNYLNDFGGGFAHTPDLVGHLEAASGRSLANFFDQWYYNEGFPSYRVDWAQAGTQVDVNITQTQSHSSVAFFEMPVPVRFIGLFRDTTVVFEHSFSGQSFSFSLPFRAVAAEFDPELWILSGNNVVVGIEEQLPSGTRIDIWPNPAQNQLFIQHQAAGLVFERISIYNSLGQEVYRELRPDGQQLSLDISALPAGAYSVKINTNKGYTARMVVKI